MRAVFKDEPNGCFIIIKNINGINVSLNYY